MCKFFDNFFIIFFNFFAYIIYDIKKCENFANFFVFYANMAKFSKICPASGTYFLSFSNPHQRPLENLYKVDTVA